MFFVAKLLAFLPFGNFLRGPLGKIVMIISALLLIYGGFQYWLYRHDAFIKTQLIAEYNQQQAELTRTLQAQYDQQLLDIQNSQNLLVVELQSKVSKLTDQRISIIDQLRNSGLTGGDASEVLRGAVQLLSDQQGG